MVCYRPHRRSVAATGLPWVNVSWSGESSIAVETPRQTLCLTQQSYNRRMAELFLYKIGTIA
jgi:hypothetical protein